MSPTLQAKIAEVFDEPGCDINQSKSAKERKKGCTKQLTPGAAAGGCAFDGAKIALQPIVDVAHLVHGPIACEGNSWDNRHSASSGPQTYRTGFTTDITELDVIYGAEKRLFKAIREVIERQNPAAVFVYQTCVTGMIGDDIEAVCKRAAERFSKPVIPVNSPGFAGPKNLGNKLGAEALLDYVVGTVEPEFTTPTDINIIGEYNLSGELWQIKPLLDALGVRVLSCISGDGRYNEVASAHRAKANMMVCSKSMINIATRMQQRWGHPLLRGLVLRHQRHEHHAARDRAAADRARRRSKLEGAHRSADRRRRGARLGAHPRLSRAPHGQEGAADHRRREELVGRLGAAGSRASRSSAPASRRARRKTRRRSRRSWATVPTPT